MENEFGEKRFFIRATNCGKFMRFDVPTSEPISAKKIMIHWTPAQEKGVYIPTKEKTRMLKNYAELGRLDGIFTPEAIEAAKKGKFPKTEFEDQMYPMPWDFRYFIPTDMGGRADPRNVRFGNNLTFYNLFHELLYPLELKMKEVSAKFNYCVFQMPAPPRVMTHAWYQRFYALNQQAEQDFLKKLEIYHSDSSIMEIQTADTVVLKIENHPFVHCPVQRVKVADPIPNGRAEFTQDIKLQHKIYRRDAMALKGLSSPERSCMLHCHEYPDRMPLQLHHILGLSLGGKNKPENLLFVSPEVHKMFNATVEKPLQYFIEQHLGYPGKELFIEMPVPMNAYRVRELPIQIPEIKPPRAQAKKAIRRKVRRKSKCELGIILEIYNHERED